MRCYIYNVVNNHNMGMKELYMYLRTWNGLIAIQDLRTYKINKIRRILQWALFLLQFKTVQI